MVNEGFSAYDLIMKAIYSGTNLTYLGHAVPGTADEDAAWRISLSTYDGSNNKTTTLFASGTEKFDKVWDDRATYSYS